MLARRGWLLQRHGRPALLLAQPVRLLADAPPMREGWLLAATTASSSPAAAARSPREARLLDARAVPTALAVGAVLDARGEATKDWRVNAALGLRQPAAAQGLRVRVVLPVLAARAGRVEARWLDATPREERVRPPGPSASEGPATLGALAREQPTPGFTVLLLP